jgi:hypothetical protein
VTGARPNHQSIGGSDPNHQGIWRPPRVGLGPVRNPVLQHRVSTCFPCGTLEEPGTLTQGVALFSLTPLVWEWNPKLQGGWCKPNNHQPSGDLEPTQGWAGTREEPCTITSCDGNLLVVRRTGDRHPDGLLGCLGSEHCLERDDRSQSCCGFYFNLNRN